MANVRLAFTFAPLVQMQLCRVTKRLHKTVREDRLFDDGLSASQLFRLSAARLGQQAEDLQIQPDERDHQAKCAVPFHELRRSIPHAGFDHVKIENQIQRRYDDHKEAEADAHGAAAVDRRDLNVEETAKNHFHEIEKRDAASGGDHAELEALRRANHSRFVGEQHDEQRAEGEAHGLNRDAWVRMLEHGGDAAERQAFEERVDGRGE